MGRSQYQNQNHKHTPAPNPHNPKPYPALPCSSQTRSVDCEGQGALGINSKTLGAPSSRRAPQGEGSTHSLATSEPGFHSPGENKGLEAVNCVLSPTGQQHFQNDKGLSREPREKKLIFSDVLLAVVNNDY